MDLYTIHYLPMAFRNPFAPSTHIPSHPHLLYRKSTGALLVNIRHTKRLAHYATVIRPLLSDTTIKYINRVLYTKKKN